MRFDRVLCLAGFFGWLTMLLGEICQVEGAMIPWGMVLWASLLAATVAGAVGFVWDKEIPE